METIRQDIPGPEDAKPPIQTGADRRKSIAGRNLFDCLAISVTRAARRESGRRSEGSNLIPIAGAVGA